MTTRPRILFLAQCLPYPPQSGPRIRTLNILRQLQRDFDVTLLAFSRRTHQPLASDLESARAELRRVVTDIGVPVPIPNERSQIRRVWDHGRSVLTRRPYTYYEYRSRAFATQLSQALGRNPPDLVHLDSIDLYGFLQDLPDVPTACTHHDIDPLLLRLRAAQTPGILGSYLRHQADLVERVFRDVCPRMQLNVMMSAIDAERLRDMAPGSRTLVAPNGVDTEYFQPVLDGAPLDGRIVFVGSTHQFANRDAVEYMLSDIFPRVRARHSGATLALIGAHSPADAARYASRPGVMNLGHVADVRPHLAQAACAVVPIRVGGGTRLKILDAWAMAKAIVATRIGCEGLNAIDGENILIRDTPEAFAEAIAAVLADPEARLRLGASGRATAEKTYAWDLIGRELRAAYWGLLGVAV